MLDPTTSYLCLSNKLSNKPKQPCPSHPSKPCSAMLLLLAAQLLLSMHARILSTVILLLLGLGYHIIIFIVDDVIIIMLTIFDEGWKVRLSHLGALFHSSHLGSRVPGIVSLDERA